MHSVLAYVQKPTGSAETTGGTLAVVQGMEDLVNTGEYENIVLYDTAKECIQAVEKGTARPLGDGILHL